MTTIQTRNATLPDLANLLREQQARKLDLIVPVPKLRAEAGALVVEGTEPVITDDGVTLGDGHYLPTAIADEGVATKLGIPLAYVRRMRAEHTPLWDANVNGWLEHQQDKTYLLRTFRADNPEDPFSQGIARALMSDRYATMDNLDALLATLDGLRAAGLNGDRLVIRGADLTERRMVVRVTVPEVAALAPQLLKGYRSPYSGNSGDENPTVFAGLEISNSETGGGAYTITPRLEVQVCTNGMKMTKDAMRAVHLGGKLEEGVIAWSADTVHKAAELIRAKSRDAVESFLTPGFLEASIAKLEAKAGEEVSTPKQVEAVTKGLSFSQEQMDDILGDFIKGGQTTLGGVAAAITSAAQRQTDPDDAFQMENAAAQLLGV